MFGIDGSSGFHLFEVDARHFVYDIHRGSALRFDSVHHRVLELVLEGRKPPWIVRDLAPRFGAEPVTRALSEILGLAHHGVLGGSRPDFGAARTGVAQAILPQLRAGELGPARAVDVLVSQDCNMRCGYCWNKQGHFDADASMMDVRTGRAVIDFLADQGAAPVDILLFGGEPLLDIDFLDGFLGYAREVSGRRGKVFTAQINTNGTLLDRWRLELLCRHDVRVTVSFDGPRTIQDVNRPMRDGRPSFDRVVEGMQRYADVTGRMPDVRVTMSPFSDSWIETFEFLRGMGVMRIDTAYSFGCPSEILDPAFAWSSEERLERSTRELREFSAHYLEYLCTLGDDEPPCIEGFFFDFAAKAFKGLRCHNCGVFSGANLAFAADGSIYPCVDAVGKPSMRMGDVFDGVKDTAALQAAADRFADDIPECRDCWIRYLCAGGCFVRNSAGGKNGFGFTCEPDECRTSRRTFEIALAFLAELMERSPALFSRHFGSLAEQPRC